MPEAATRLVNQAQPVSDGQQIYVPTQEEAEALEAISKAGYEIEFALIKEASIGTWDKFRGQFGFN